MQNSIPVKMKAITQDGPGGDLNISEVDVPIPQKGEVLIKMAFSPVNPSDLSQLKGTFTPKPTYPFTPGIEGSGIVVATGSGIIAAMRSGKRVSCSSKKGNGGTWSEYMVTDATKCIPLKKSVSLEQGAMMLVNPLTAMSFIEIAKREKKKVIVNNAAASALGIMLVKLSKRYNIKLINIVRSENQADILRNLKADYVLISSEKSFKDELKRLSLSLGATLFFDAVGGEQTTIMAEASPAGSRIILYARLSETSFTLDSRTLLQHGKSIDGFSLPLWNAKKSIFSLLKLTGRVQSLVGSDLNTNVKAKYPLSNINSAIDDYTRSMTGGKVLLEL